MSKTFSSSKRCGAVTDLAGHFNRCHRYALGLFPTFPLAPLHLQGNYVSPSPPLSCSTFMQLFVKICNTIYARKQKLFIISPNDFELNGLAMLDKHKVALL